MTKITPPKYLEKPEKDFWSKMVAEYDIPDSAGLAQLEVACTAMMRARHCRDHLAAHGEILPNGRANPAMAAELMHAKLMLAALKQLGLDIVPPGVPGRPTETVKRVYS
jgi:phage terminase small subunit